MGFLKRNITNICIILVYLSLIILFIIPIDIGTNMRSFVVALIILSTMIYLKPNKRIIFIYLLLLICSIIPMDMDGYFRTIAIIQHNARPFIVAFITVSVTIYLKIYNDVDNRNKEDIEKFKEDFKKAYSDLQTKIKKFENDGLEHDDLEGIFIKTNLRYLMKEKIISKKCNFPSFYNNCILWKKQEKIYACDCILENRKNLIQSCLDEIKSKNQNDDIILRNANLEYINFKNIDYDSVNCLHDYDYEVNIDITGTSFHSSNFSNSNINFAGDRDVVNNFHLGWFNNATFSNSKIYFGCSIHMTEHQNKKLSFKFPEINYIKSENSILIFHIYTDFHYEPYNDNFYKHCNDVVDFFKEFLKNIQTMEKNKIKGKTKFIFYFCKFDLCTEQKEGKIYYELKKIETAHNDDPNNYYKVLFCSDGFPIKDIERVFTMKSTDDIINFLESNNLTIPRNIIYLHQCV